MVRHLVFVGPNIFWTENTFKTANYTTICMHSGIGLLDGNESLNQSLTDIFGHGSNIAPMSTIGNLDGKILNLHIGIFFTSFGHVAIKLLVVHITDAFEEQQGEDVFLISGSVDLTAQSCGSSPKELFHFIESKTAVRRTVF